MTPDPTAPHGDPDRPKNRAAGVQTPRRRAGPRPLGLHLATAWAMWSNSRLAWQTLSAASETWKAATCEGAVDDGRRATIEAFDRLTALAAKRTVDDGPDQDDARPGRFAQTDLLDALEREGRRRLGDALAGFAAYRRHPYRRCVVEAPICYRNGSATLRDFSRTESATGLRSERDEGSAGRSDAQPILIVPSLINRAYILDLAEHRSFARDLARRGFRPLLVDWGAPDEAERQWTLSDYIAGPLDAMVDWVLHDGGRRPIVLGYCMGGNLALALTQRRQADILGLGLLATPWDFHAERSQQAKLAATLMRLWTPIIDRMGVLPTDALQTLFAALDPISIPKKFAAFARIAPNCAAARDFVAVEDWLADGVALAAPVAEECLVSWFGQNAPAAGRWMVDGEPVEPGRITLPVLCVVPQRDRIVPPASAGRLADAIRHGQRFDPPLGHIGMMVGARARRHTWDPLAGWLEDMAHRRSA